MSSLEENVKRANREYHNSLDPEEYHENPSIFDEERQQQIRSTLEEISDAEGGLLDVGCGTGNILRWGKEYFDRIVGVDISENMLDLAGENVPESQVCLTDASSLPFRDGTFQAVTFYATLHHFPAPEKFLIEGLRVLEPGGYLYTDHDPNYFLVRFYYPLFKLLYRGKEAFGSQEGDLAEYFHTQEPGINPEYLAKSLKEAGAEEVSINYRNTQNEQLSSGKAAIMSLLRPLSEMFGWKSFFTHFSIRAKK